MNNCSTNSRRLPLNRFGYNPPSQSPNAGVFSWPY